MCPRRSSASSRTESFAAASIGQVHRAMLRDGKPVAVKVQRRASSEALQADIDLMFATSRAARLDRRLRRHAQPAGHRGVRALDGRRARLHGRGPPGGAALPARKGEPLERVARVYREYSTARVLTTELIEGIPLVDIIVALREHDAGYLESLAERGYDLDKVILHLDWNMLNQVYVFGYFHADLHPANLYVLPGNAIGYVDFGIVGQLPDRVRGSLTRYSWLLFRGEVESAVEELMRWLAPSGGHRRGHRALAAHPRPPGLPLRHRSARRLRRARAAGSLDRGADNPYVRLAVDIMAIIREHELTLAPSLVAYLKMLVTLGTLRHELASHYDLPRHVLRFFRKLVRQQGVAFLDPRLMVDRLYAGGVRLQRAMDFLEFIEAQEPVIADRHGDAVRLPAASAQRPPPAGEPRRRRAHGRSGPVLRAGRPRATPIACCRRASATTSSTSGCCWCSSTSSARSS